MKSIEVLAGEHLSLDRKRLAHEGSHKRPASSLNDDIGYLYLTILPRQLGRQVDVGMQVELQSVAERDINVDRIMTLSVVVSWLRLCAEDRFRERGRDGHE